MLAEISCFDGKFPDEIMGKYTSYAGAYCKCGRCNFVKTKNLSVGFNPITCKFCGYTTNLYTNKCLNNLQKMF